MKTGEFRLKRYSGQPGQANFRTYHGNVELEIERSTEDEIVGSGYYNLSNPGKNAYTSAVIFGIHYGLNEYRKETRDRTRFLIKVIQYQVIPVDSSPTIIAYVAAKAVLNAFQLDNNLEWPLLKEEEGCFIFRK